MHLRSFFYVRVCLPFQFYSFERNHLYWRTWTFLLTFYTWCKHLYWNREIFDLSTLLGFWRLIHRLGLRWWVHEFGLRCLVYEFWFRFLVYGFGFRFLVYGFGFNSIFSWIRLKLLLNWIEKRSILLLSRIRLGLVRESCGWEIPVTTSHPPRKNRISNGNSVGEWEYRRRKKEKDRSRKKGKGKGGWGARHAVGGHSRFLCLGLITVNYRLLRVFNRLLTVCDPGICKKKFSIDLSFGKRKKFCVHLCFLIPNYFFLILLILIYILLSNNIVLSKFPFVFCTYIFPYCTHVLFGQQASLSFSPSKFVNGMAIIFYCLLTEKKGKNL